MRVLIVMLPRVSKSAITHLKGILQPGHVPEDIDLILYANQLIIDSIGDIDKKVRVVSDNNIPSHPIKMHLWRINNISRLIDLYKPNIHFCVLEHLGRLPNETVKHVVMSRTLQPFLASERKRFPILSYDRLKMFFLYKYYQNSLNRADGVIFLTDFVRDFLKELGVNCKDSIVIQHGIPDYFRRKPVIKQLPKYPKILYVSDIMEYKFQWNVAKGVDILRKRTGIEIQLELVGKKTKYGWPILNKTLAELNNPDWIAIKDPVPYSEVHKIYQSCDVFVFASSVETISNILLEAMASGLPIAYTNLRPMKDILEDDGLSFNHENPDSIADALEKYFLDDNLRYKAALGAYNRAIRYNWKETADATFNYLKKISISEKH